MSKFYTKSAASFKATTIDSKIVDGQKILINTESSNINERRNLIDYINRKDNDNTSLIEGGFKSVGVYSTNYVNSDLLDNANVTGIQFSNEHFVKGGSRVDAITLPYNYTSTVTSVGYLSAQICVTEGEFEDKIYYSTNRFNYDNDTKSEAIFEFKDFILPKDYLYVRLCLVPSIISVPNNDQNTNCLNFRVRPIKSNDGNIIIDDDGCLAYVNTTINRWLIDARIEYSELIEGIGTTVEETEEKLNFLISRTNLFERSEVSTISSIPQNSGYCDAFSIHNSKIPSNYIKSIEIPVRNVITTETFIVVYDVDPVTFDKKLLGRSENSNTWEEGDNVIWTFENPIRVETGHNIEVYLATESSTITDISVDPVGYYLVISRNDSGTDAIRHENEWIQGREIYLIFHVVEYRDIANAIENTENSLSMMSQLVSDHIISTEDKYDVIDTTIGEIETKIENIDTNLNALMTEVGEIDGNITNIEQDLNTLKGKNYAYTDSSNTFSSSNTFNSPVTINGNLTSSASSSITIADNFNVLPLGVKTAAGVDAYGLSVSSTGGIQIWGTHFTQEDEWTPNALKIQHRNLALLGDHTAPTTLTFDNANVIEFKVMPDDGSTANNGQGAIFDFQAWQWDNDIHTSKNANCPVQILKNNSGSLTERSLLNKAELDENYIAASEENIHIVETLNEKIDTSDGYAIGWIYLNTDSVTAEIFIGEYGPYEMTGIEVGVRGQDWCDIINNANIPYEAYVDDSTDYRFFIKAKNPGEGYCVNFGLLYDGVKDVVNTYSGSTLEIPDKNLKKIDFLSEAQTRFAQRATDNIFEEYNTFNHTIFAKEDIIVTNGVLTFEDTTDGTVIITPDGTLTESSVGASGYRYVQMMPTAFENGVCYDIGEITNETNFYEIGFTGKGKLVQTCEIWFTTSATPPTNHQWPKDIWWIDSATGTAPTLIASKNYRIVFRNEPNKIIASIAYIY